MGVTLGANEVARKSGFDSSDRRVIHKIQPTNRSCGQTCLAMILGIPVGDVFVALKRTRGTNGRDIRRFLTSRGRTSHVEQPYRGVLPSVAIVNVQFPTQGHWIVWANRRFYDPGCADPTYSVRRGRIRSFIEVT